MVLGVGLLLMVESTSVSIPSSHDGSKLIVKAHGCYGGTPLLEITKEGKLIKRGFLLVSSQFFFNALIFI